MVIDYKISSGGNQDYSMLSTAVLKTAFFMKMERQLSLPDQNIDHLCSTLKLESFFNLIYHNWTMISTNSSTIFR